ncbi:MAG: glycosyltransferase [Endomicrobiaceae bacterium]|nr:glycosyltransferase [Endomicrobiaceae bacterium]
MDKIKISIIIPVYNAELYLPQCLDSVTRQTFTDFECICINDGSTDSSLNILTKHSEKDKRFKIISQQNGGVSQARNTGLKTACGKYISFADPDDWLSTNYLEILHDTIEKYGCDVIASENFFYDAKTKKTHIKRLPEKFYRCELKSIDAKKKLIPALNICPCWGKIYKADFLKLNEIFFQKCPMEDVIFTYDILTSGCSIMFIKDALYFYRKNIEGSATYNSPKRIYDMFECFLFLKKRLHEKKSYDDFKNAFLAHAAKCFAFEFEESNLPLKTLKSVFLNIKNDFFKNGEKLLYPENIFYKARIFLFQFCLKYNINYAKVGKFLKKIYLFIAKNKTDE